MRFNECGEIFLAAAARQGWKESSGVVCALSGGGDLVALLWLLKNFFKGKIVAAHLDHCTRNGASREDADFVRGLCRKWGIICEVLTVDVHALRERGESFEMAGRRFRYRHFEDTARAYGAPFIALGHNADDVVETQMMNLARGSGIAGLRGIPERRGNIVRPVIDFGRAELREILKENSVPWREDYTNDEDCYARNKVRNVLIPWIKENLNPRFERVMKGLASEAAEDAEEKERRAAFEIEKISSSEIFLSRPIFAKSLKIFTTSFTSILNISKSSHI